jgi:hypothetical protein
MSGTTTVYYALVAGSGEIMRAGATSSDQWPAFAQTSPSAVAITQQQYNQLLGGGRWLYLASAKNIVLIPSSEPPLADAQAAASATIDLQAEQSRRLFITPGSGQAMVYLQKSISAANFLSLYPTAAAFAAASPAPTAAQYPLIGASVGIPGQGSNLFEAASIIATISAIWEGTAARIEYLRLSAKAAVAAATSYAEIASAIAITWPQPEVAQASLALPSPAASARSSQSIAATAHAVLPALAVRASGTANDTATGSAKVAPATATGT